MDGFTGSKTAAVKEAPQAVTVMDPFHVVHLTADALGERRRRTQQNIFGHRGRPGDALYRARRSPHTDADLPTDPAKTRPQDLLTDEPHTAVEVT